jgi:ABC-type transport system involved in multi-copper enzyme maturation permease subunit
MTKTLALLIDAYRELNAKRLFWVVMVISALVVGIFGIVGIRNDSVTILNWESPLRFIYLSLITPATFYKLLFVSLGIQYWLSSLAIILALVSAAGIFPDFLAGGSVELYLSKPISRLRLFTTKYLGGLLFVALQVTVFCVASFLVLGFRGGTWEPGLFLAVPLVVLMFSYLFAICVLFGVLTRSTVAALLLTLLFWFVLWAVHSSEVLLLRAEIADQHQAQRLDRQIAAAEAELAQPTTAPTTRSTDDPNGSWWQRWLASVPTETRIQTEARLTDLRRERQAATDPFGPAHRVAYAIALPLPKTSETIGLLERELVSRADLPAPEPDDETVPTQENGRQGFRARGRENAAANAQLDVELRQRSLTWVLGTSCIFEGATLILAAWLFCRRDF